MREIVGQSDIEPLLTEARAKTEAAVQALMQKTLESYGAGVQVTHVQLQKVDPPSQVIDAFRDVQAARADLERAQNEAQTYANKVVPEARGRASQITQNAEAYREQTVAEAKGATSRFLQVYDEYKKAPDVTRQRMYLETMERLFGGTDKIIMDSGASGGVVPYLPLDQLMRRPQSAPQAGGGGTTFGDGFRCVGGQVVRLGLEQNAAGMSAYPSGSDSPISIQGHVVAPGSRFYQVWYRNAAVFCKADTFNLTNGLSVTWGP